MQYYNFYEEIKSITSSPSAPVSAALLFTACFFV